MSAADTSPITQIVNEEISYGMKWSLLGHLILAVLILTNTWIFPGQSMRYVPTLKVDLVGLPDVLKKNQNQVKRSQFNHDISKILKQAELDANRIKSSPRVQSTTLKDDGKAVQVHSNTSHQAVESRNKQALNRIKSLAKIQDSSNLEHNLPHPVLPVKGNILSPGSSLSGEAKETAEANYLDLVRDRLQEYWTLPTWLARQNLGAQIQIYIDSKGQLRTFKFIKSSGNIQFDDAVKRALQESQPFPLPPKDIAGSLLTHGILIGFPL